MSRKTALWMLLATAVAGMAAAADLAYIKYRVEAAETGYRSFCNISAAVNCDRVAVSEWSTLFGVPIALFGLLTYGLIAALAVRALRDRRQPPDPWPVTLIAWIGAGSVAYSVFLAYVSHFRIGSWCLMCVALYAVNLMIAGLGFWLAPRSWRQQTRVAGQTLRAYFGDPWRSVSAVMMALAVGSALLYATQAQSFRQRPTTSQLLANLRTLSPPVSLEGPFVGNPAAPLTLVVFSDFQCPHCRTLFFALEHLTKRFDGLKVVHKDFPLDGRCNPKVQGVNHPAACMAAWHARCAERQGRGAEMIEKLFIHQDFLDQRKFRDIVGELGLDMAKFTRCLDSDAMREALSRDVEDGLRIGLDGAPALLIDGKHQYLGPLDEASLEQLVSQRLKKLSAEGAAP